MSWYQDYLGAPIGFVVQTRHGKYSPLIGTVHESDGDDDCFINIVGKQAPQETLADALALLDGEAKNLHCIFRNPTTPSDMGFWLHPLVLGEWGDDPRRPVIKDRVG